MARKQPAHSLPLHSQGSVVAEHDRGLVRDTHSQVHSTRFLQDRQGPRGHIDNYLKHWNEHPTPFVWTKEPADIIKKALRRAR